MVWGMDQQPTDSETKIDLEALEVHREKTRPERESKFYSQLSEAINSNCMESGSNTPDFLLAEYLRGCLRLWDEMVTKRDAWYGKEISDPAPLPEQNPKPEV